MTAFRGRPGAVGGGAHRRSNLRYTAPGPPLAAGWLSVDGRRLGGGSRSRYYVLEGGMLTAVGGRGRRPSATPPGVEVGLDAADGVAAAKAAAKSRSSKGGVAGGLLVNGVRAGVRRWELVVSGMTVTAGSGRSAGGAPLVAAARARVSGVVGSGDGATPARGDTEVSLFAPDAESYDAWLVALTRAARPPGAGVGDVGDYYRLSHEIGGGVQATVYQGYDLRTASAVAVKVVGRVTGDAAEEAALAKEAATVAALAHPNIVATLDVFETPDAVYFVQEYLGGSELFDYIAANDTFTEAAAAGVMRDILSGLAALHDAGIAHRDVKLENLLAVNVAPPLVVKIADFGLCATVDGDCPDACLTDLVGTSFYLAPEILAGEPYGRPVDLWAAGVTLYLCLSGRFPYGGEPAEYYEQVLDRPVYFPTEDWELISADAQSLVEGLLAKDPSRRLTATEALSHPWLTRGVSGLSASPHSTASPLPFFETIGGDGPGAGGDNGGVGASGRTWGTPVHLHPDASFASSALPTAARFRSASGKNASGRIRSLLPAAAAPRLPILSGRMGGNGKAERGGAAGKTPKRPRYAAGRLSLPIRSSRTGPTSGGRGWGGGSGSGGNRGAAAGSDSDVDREMDEGGDSGGALGRRSSLLARAINRVGGGGSGSNGGTGGKLHRPVSVPTGLGTSFLVFGSTEPGSEMDDDEALPPPARGSTAVADRDTGSSGGTTSQSVGGRRPPTATGGGGGGGGRRWVRGVAAKLRRRSASGVGGGEVDSAASVGMTGLALNPGGDGSAGSGCSSGVSILESASSEDWRTERRQRRATLGGGEDPRAPTMGTSDAYGLGLGALGIR